MTRIKHILIGQKPGRTMVRMFLLMVFSIMVFGFIARPVRVQGISMEPTLRNGSIHFITMITLLRRELTRGTLVAISMPGGQAFYMKRIIGLPGEDISFRHGNLLINGHTLDEPYLIHPGQWELKSIRIPTDSYFVAGDNRETEFSDHTLGVVKRHNITGVLLK